METERALDLMVVLVFYAIENKTNPGMPKYDIMKNYAHTLL